MNENEKYPEILDVIFDNIFELDFNKKTLMNIKSSSGVLCCAPSPIRMYMDDALKAWIDNEVYPEDREAVRALFVYAAKADADNRKMRLQFRVSGCCGGVSWYFGEIIRISDGKCWFGFNLIDGQKAVEILNREYEEKKTQTVWASKRALICSMAGVVVADFDFSLNRFWSADGYEKYGFSTLSPQQLIQTETAAEYVYGEDRERFADFMHRVHLGNNEYSSVKVRLRMADGTFLWNEVGACVFPGSGAGRVIFSFRIIEDEKTKEAALVSSHSFFSDILNNSGNAIYTFRFIDGKRVITFANKPLCDILGVDFKAVHSGFPNGFGQDEVIKTHFLTDKQIDKLIQSGICEFELNGEKFLFRCRKAECFYLVTVIRKTVMTDAIRNVTKEEERSVKIVTFGYFDVFVDGKPILFKNAKAKELLALLVDRRGGYVSPSEAISCLWEDEPVNDRTLARYRKTAMQLRDTLREHSAEKILESYGGKRRIVPENVNCDLFGYLACDSKYISSFKGIYMLNYSWGEITLSSLM